MKVLLCVNCFVLGKSTQWMFQVDFVQNKSVATVKNTMIIQMEVKLEKIILKQIKTNMNHKQFPPQRK